MQDHRFGIAPERGLDLEEAAVLDLLQRRQRSPGAIQIVVTI